MFQRLLRHGRPSRRATIDAIYDEIVAAARQPVFYAEWNVPDTPLGRFEMLSLHVFLFLHRLRAGDEAAREAAQAVTDTFFSDVEHSLRELGIGDIGVPKRMKKLARMFYGRAAAYGAAIEADDEAGLAEALKRNVAPEADEWPGAVPLAAYVLTANRTLAETSSEALLAGRLPFARPGAERAGP